MEKNSVPSTNPEVDKILASIDALTPDAASELVSRLSLETTSWLVNALSMRSSTVHKKNAFADYIQKSIGRQLTQAEAVKLLMEFHQWFSQEEIEKYFFLSGGTKVRFDNPTHITNPLVMSSGTIMMNVDNADGFLNSRVIDTTTWKSIIDSIPQSHIDQ